MNSATQFLIRLSFPLGCWLVVFSSLLTLIPEFTWHRLMLLWIIGTFIFISADPLRRSFRLLLAAIFLPPAIFFVANIPLPAWSPFFQLLLACAIFGITVFAALTATLYFNRKIYLT